MEKSEAPAHKVEHLLILGLSVLCIAGAFLIEYSEDGGLSLPLPFIGAALPLPETCWSRRLLGISCPGCGLTRSFVAIAHGQLLRALEFNLMGPLLYLLCWCQIPYRLMEISGNWSTRPPWGYVNTCGEVITWLLVGALFGCWIWKLF